MTDSIPMLWPEDITVDVRTPLAILRAQATHLREKTRGILEGEIRTLPGTDGLVEHLFEIVAPALDDYRHVLFEVTHDPLMVYPATVRTPFPVPCLGPDNSFAARSEREFIETIGPVLSSKEAKSIIQSLIAKSNEIRTDPNNS